MSANPDMLAFVQNYTDMGFFSILLFLFIGAILTMIVQASAATMAITLIMCANGWIDYHLGIALVLGENIGTTITANLAALTANTQARRAALAHLMFNLFGVAWVLIVFYPFTGAVSWFVTHVMKITDPAVAVSFKLAAFHTAFNISNTFIMIWFVNVIEKPFAESSGLNRKMKNIVCRISQEVCYQQQNSLSFKLRKKLPCLPNGRQKCLAW